MDAPPFVLLPLADGRFELRAFSDDSPDPIVLLLDQQDGRALGVALAEVLSAIDAPGLPPVVVNLKVAGRDVTVAGTANGLRLTVGR